MQMIFEIFAGDGLLQHRHITKLLIDAFATITGDKSKRNVTLEEKLGNRINGLTAEIEIKNRTVEFSLRRSKRLVQSAVRANDKQTEFRKKIPHHQTYNRLVFSKKHAPHRTGGKFYEIL